MNSSFEVRNAGINKGFGLFALKDFEKDEVVFEEKPLVAAQFQWNEAYGYLACHYCLRPMESLSENIRRLTNNDALIIPYPELCPTNKSEHRFCDHCGVGFCNKTCKELSLKEYHRTLCPAYVPSLNALIEEWKPMHYPPETTSIMLLLKIIGYIEQAEDQEKAVSTFLEFEHNCVNENEDMLMKFLGTGHSIKLQKIHAAIQNVLPTSFVKNFVTEDGLKKLFALIGRNGQGIGTSVYSDWVKRVEKLNIGLEEKDVVDNFINRVYEAMHEHVGQFLNCEGSGLYQCQRILNHSCVPNASVTFPYSNSTLSLVTKRRIAAGEEICISYLDECTLNRSRHSRQVTLRDYYLFECQCEKCIEQADHPDVTSEEDEEEDDDNDDMLDED